MSPDEVSCKIFMSRWLWREEFFEVARILCALLVSKLIFGGEVILFGIY